MGRKLNTLKVFLDVCVAALFIVALKLMEAYSTPRRNGFFCDDESIRYPFRHGSISVPVLYTVTFGLPIISVRILICRSHHLSAIN